VGGAAVNPAPKPTKERKKRRKKYLTPRQRMEVKLEDMCKQIVHWRDGLECLDVNLDGSRCGGGIQFGHVIPRKQSYWLKYSLSNVGDQCRNHNGMHDRGDPIHIMAFEAKFGKQSLIALRETAKEHAPGKQPMTEMEEMLSELSRLYEERFAHGTDTLAELVEAGYYGEIVKDVWTKEGRI